MSTEKENLDAHQGDAQRCAMAQKAKELAINERDSTRITVTLPRGDYEQVCRIASAKKVSASWVVRDAVDDYLKRDIPLLGGVGNLTMTQTKST